MKISCINIIPKIVFAGLIGGLLIQYSCKSVKTGMLIATVVPGNFLDQVAVNGDLYSYIQEAKIIAFYPDKPASARIITNDFYSACFPKISFDGSHMLFSARQKTGDSWQIWEMDLDNLKSRKITSSTEDCTDPAYLPGARIVFSKSTVNDTVRAAHCLYTSSLDGSGLKQITFSPNDNLATTTLKDGRLLTLSRQLLPVRGEAMLMVMRPDGTKASMFYKVSGRNALAGSASGTMDGRLVFIEYPGENSTGGDLISVNYNRPLHTRNNLTSGIREDIRSVLPLNAHKYLVSCRGSDSENFALYEFDPDKNLLGRLVFSDPEYNVLDVAVVEKHERPKNLPSEVDPGVKTGLLLCQDINFLNLPADENSLDIHRARKIEVLGIDTAYGVVDVEEDGSFYLKVMADTPFRIRTLDDQGKVINGPCSWLWLRPNERRGCVGCHEDPGMVPENKVSLAIKKSPVIIPVHITGIREKTIELE